MCLSRESTATPFPANCRSTEHAYFAWYKVGWYSGTAVALGVSLGPRAGCDFLLFIVAKQSLHLFSICGSDAIDEQNPES